MNADFWVPQLGKICLPSPKTCQDAVAELGRVSGIPRMPKLTWLGRHIGLFYKGVFLVATQTNRKPPLEKVVAWPMEGQTLWLPSERNTDLVELCQHVGETSDLNLVVWHGFVNMDFGIVEKKVIPRQVTEQTIKEFGIELRPYVKDLSDLPCNSTLWWKEWGGSLFLTRIDRDVGVIEFRLNTLASCIGRYRKLPKKL